MTAKEYMVQVRKAENELKLISERRRHYKELATSIGVKLTGMPSSKSKGSSVESGAIGLVDLENDLNKKEAEYTKLVKQAEGLIEKIPQEKFRMILVLKYICGHSWKLLRDEMDYADEKSVYRCHGYALKALQKLL
ncbi:MAG: hypothetical protein J6Y20_10070 [Lachnospiraceae bacterium]|nr:hypothetical protein [Lachnospiraceae bacterium]MBP5462459.1 hypothetical protein [Lachnospiraceae bacterium]